MMMSGDITTVTTVGGSTTSSIEATQPDRSATCEGGAVEAVMREGVVSMRVIDNGPGVSEDIEPYLFKRYLDGGGRALLSGSIGLGTAVAARTLSRSEERLSISETASGRCSRSVFLR